MVGYGIRQNKYWIHHIGPDHPILESNHYIPGVLSPRVSWMACDRKGERRKRGNGEIKELQVKRELAECLRKDGFTNVSQAIGADHKK